MYYLSEVWFEPKNQLFHRKCGISVKIQFFMKRSLSCSKSRFLPERHPKYLLKCIAIAAFRGKWRGESLFHEETHFSREICVLMGNMWISWKTKNSRGIHTFCTPTQNHQYSYRIIDGFGERFRADMLISLKTCLFARNHIFSAEITYFIKRRTFS